MYELELTAEFLKELARLRRTDKRLIKRVDKVLQRLSTDPYHPGLRTHKAQTRNFGLVYSSRVTGDLRIIWLFGDAGQVIVLLTVEGHEVYK